MTDDLMDEKDDSASDFERLVDEIHHDFGKRNFIVSRMKLRRALIVYSAQTKLPPTSAAKVVQVLLSAHTVSPAELINLA